MQLRSVFPAVAAAFVLSACGTLSQVDDAGQTDEPVFPDADKVNFVTGSFPNLDNLRLIDQDMTRDQLYNLIGRPHFSEGFKVREWDYLFHFRTDEGIETCQYKILFDKDYLAQSFFWKPEACADLVAGVAKSDPVQTFTLEGDIGFGFDSAVLSAQGQETVADIAAQIQAADGVQSVTIVGFTDRLGSATYNQQLSEQRAMSVQQALIAAGVQANLIQAYGRGAADPLVQCDQTDHNALVACLAPNRRVEIQTR